MAAVNQIAILFILIVAGWGARKLRVFSEEAVSGMSALLLDVTMPCLIVSSMQRPFSPAILAEAGMMLGLAFAVYLSSFAFAALVPLALRSPRGDRGVSMYAVVFSNTGFMGFPVIEALFGRQALFMAAIYNVPFNLLAFSIGAWALARDGSRPIRFSWRLLVNPNVIASVLGLALFACSITLPGPLGKAVDLAGSTTTPLSMLLIGAMLAASDFRSILGNARIWAVALIRLAVMPFLVYAGLYLCGVRGLALNVPTATAAMPVAANTPIMARTYGNDSTFASAVVTVSTLLSAATIPAIAAVLFG